MSNMNAFERTIDALQNQGLNSDEILEELKLLFRHLNANEEAVTSFIKDDGKILENRVKKLLFDIGIPSHLSGYDYIIKAVMMYIENPSQKLTQEIYPAIAREFNTTEGGVKWAIGYAIKTCWKNCNFEVLHSMFGETVNSEKKVPTRVKFIAMCANYLKQ